jgi:hypothetical protein
VTVGDGALNRSFDMHSEAGKGSRGSISLDSVTDLTMFSRSVDVRCFDTDMELSFDSMSSENGLAMTLSNDELEPADLDNSGRLLSDELRRSELARD